MEFFVSYFDYYQREAYIPHTDTYIEKDSSTNQEIDRLRHSATSSLGERRDVIIVASVSCIYGLGDPIDYTNMVLSLRPGMTKSREEIIKKLVEIRYERNDIAFERNAFRVRGDTIEVFPAYSSDTAVRIELFGDEVERISEITVLTGAVKRQLMHIAVYRPRIIFQRPRRWRVPSEILSEMEERVKYFEREGKLIEAQRTASARCLTLK